MGSNKTAFLFALKAMQKMDLEEPVAVASPTPEIS